MHNGIIENANSSGPPGGQGCEDGQLDTDTEALAHRSPPSAADGVSLEEGGRPGTAPREGTYGLVVLDVRHPNELVVARNGSPHRAGHRRDPRCSSPPTSPRSCATPSRWCTWTTPRWRRSTPTDYRHVALDEQPARPGSGGRRPPGGSRGRDYELGAFEDFMRKEIHEQPEALRRALRGRCSTSGSPRPGWAESNLDARAAQVDQAGQIPRLRLRLLRRPDGRGPGRGTGPDPVRCRAASEFRYRNPVVDPTRSTWRSASPARRWTR